MIKRILKTLGLIFLLLLVFIIGGVSWVIGTENGFQQALALAKKFAPGTLQWDEADGKLIGPLQVQGLHYKQDGVIEASVGTLNFDWRPSALLSTELAVDQLHVDNVEVHLAEAAEPQEQEAPSGGQLPDISLPVSISLDDIAVTNVSVYPAGQDTAIQIDRVALSGSVEQSDVHLSALEVFAPQGELHLAGDVKTSGDYPMNLTLGWQADIGQSSPLKGEGTVAGSLAELKIDHQVAGFAVADVAATVSDVTQSPGWDASIEASLPNPESLSPLLSGTPQITLTSNGTLDKYQANATVNVETTETGPVSVDADVSGSTEALDINSLIARLTDNGGELSATGELSFASLQGDIKGQWQSLSWPLKSAPQFSSGKGSFDAKGSPDEFSANLTADVDGEAIPAGQWAVSLDGSATALDNFVVLGQTLGGAVNASGTANWEEQPSWDVELSTENINPGSQWSDFPGSINLEVSSSGQINEDGPVLNADIKRLSGHLRDQALSGSGLVRLAGEKLNIDKLNVTHGSTQLDANGEIDDQIALDFELGSPDLRTLMPDLAGSISVVGKVSGSKEAPLIDARGSADNVAYTGNSVSKLNFSINGGPGQNVVSNLSVEASGISAGGQKVSKINLAGKGSQSDHRVVLSASTDQGDIATQLEGSYQGNTWNGSLASLELDKTMAGDWRLRKPVSITANAQKADASELCLDNSEKLGSLCAAGNWLAAGESKATLNLSGISPALASAFMPPGFILKTELNGDATARLGTDGALDAGAKLVLSPGKLTLNSDTSPVEIGLEKTTIDAGWRGNDASLNMATAFTKLGTLNVKASLADPAGKGRLAGKIDANFPDLTLISAFAPQIQQVSGALKSNLSLGGTLQSPQIEGELALQNFSAEVPETAMLIEDTQLTLRGKPDGTLIINGESHSGGGQLDIKGSVNPSTRALKLNINGESYAVADTAMMKAVVSPELSIAMDDSGMQVSGKVTIPKVYINANGGNEGIKTVSSSSDVVYVTEEGEEAETPASQLDLDVQIILGDSVEVEAGDFRGRLEGDMRVQQQPEIAPRGTGTINVLNGDYVIYGQQLNMERGRILFGGGPVDNPSLDMEVARTVQQYDVVVGARIQGTAQSPRLELYSEPSMPDASILSYILLGQPPGTKGGSYTLGKYLTPDLYVSYGIGLFDAINTFNMRYSLTDKLALEAESGNGSSADLIYTIEK